MELNPYILAGAAHSFAAFSALVASALLLYVSVSLPTIIFFVPSGFLDVTEHLWVFASVTTYQVVAAIVAAAAGATNAARTMPVSRYLRISVSFLLSERW